MSTFIETINQDINKTLTAVENAVAAYTNVTVQGISEKLTQNLEQDMKEEQALNSDGLMTKPNGKAQYEGSII